MAVVAVAGLLAGCIVEPPYATTSTELPVSVTLTAATPVGVFDVVVDRAGLPPSASVSPYSLHLLHVDPRLRVATIVRGVGDVEPTVLGSTRRPFSGSDDLYVEIPAKGEFRLIVELTDPRPEDSVAVEGTFSVPFGYPGTPVPDAGVTVTGLAAPDLRAAPEATTVSVDGPPTTLDADHPIAIVPVSFTLRGGGDADPLELASETRFELAPGIPEGAAIPTLYAVIGEGTQARMVPARLDAPMAGCNLSPDSTCTMSLMLRWQWSATTPSVDLRYDAATTLIGYAGVGGSTVEATFGEAVTVPTEARAINATESGSLDAAGDRATAWFSLTLDGAPDAPIAGVVEVPGVLILTYSARGTDGRTDADTQVPLRFRDSAFYKSTPAHMPEVLDLLADGIPRTVAIPIFAHCAPGEDCSLEFWLELFAPRDGDIDRVRLEYAFDARVTAFDGTDLPAGAQLTLGPRPSNAP